MSGAERSGGAFVAILAALATACSSLPAPRESVPKPGQAPQDVHGAWANVRHGQGKQRVTTGGELIAVGRDSLCVSTFGPRLQSFAWNDVDRVQVVFFDPGEGGVYGIAFAGALASLGHGWYGVFTIPVWLAIGAGGGGGRVDEAVLQYPRETEDWIELRPYARFPQGLPPGFVPAADTTAAEARPPIEAVHVPAYHPPEKAGNGIVGGGGFFADGKGAWTLGYHVRTHAELFALAGYTHFDDDVFDLSQWWIGLRLGDPAFFGAKYIYTYRDADNASGVSVFAGFLTPTSRHVGIGAMAGYDFTGIDFPYKDEFWWASILLQLTLFPAE